MTPPLVSVRFVVHGPPQPKERARIGANGGRTPPATRAYESAVANIANLSIGRGWRLDGMFRLRVHAVFGDRRRRDVDNVLKAVQDALNGVGYHDDHQVVDARATKAVEPGRPRTEILLERVGDAPARKARRA